MVGIKDILSGRGAQDKPVQSQQPDMDIERLKKERDALQQELLKRSNDSAVKESYPEVDEEQVAAEEAFVAQLPEEEEVVPTVNPFKNIEEEKKRIQAKLKQEVRQPETTEQQMPSGYILFKVSFVMENNVKVPVTFPARKEDVQAILKGIETCIETSRVIALGNFRIPGDRVLFVDLN